MKAMVLTRMALLNDVPRPLRLVEMQTPVPADDELLLRVSTFGVGHTELDEIEGRLRHLACRSCWGMSLLDVWWNATNT